MLVPEVQNLDIISVNIWQILISLINLLLLFLIIKKFLYKPVKKFIAQRKASVDLQYAESLPNSRRKNPGSLGRKGLRALRAKRMRLSTAQDRKPSREPAISLPLQTIKQPASCAVPKLTLSSRSRRLALPSRTRSLTFQLNLPKRCLAARSKLPIIGSLSTRSSMALMTLPA